jgi:hypothetical protein
MKIGKLFFLAVLLLVCFFYQTAKAQTISGSVRDEQQTPIANAEVSLAAANSIVSRQTTNDAGEFSLATNEAANLILRVRAAGFALFEKRLETNENRLEIVLSPENFNEEVTVSITGAETRLTETPASVVVLSRKSLETTAAQTVDDQLRQVAGFQLFRRSSSRTSNPTTQGANFRGLSGSGASRATVLLDGVSLNDAFGGWTYWSRVPRAAVEQIETLRGGASAVYGDAALSGAINVLTKTSDQPFLRLETSLGTVLISTNYSFASPPKLFKLRATFPSPRTNADWRTPKRTAVTQAFCRFLNVASAKTREFSRGEIYFLNAATTELVCKTTAPIFDKSRRALILTTKPRARLIFACSRKNKFTIRAFPV